MYHELPKTLADIKTGSEEYKQIVRGVAEKLHKLIKSRRERGAKRESSSTVKEQSEKVDLGTGTVDWLEYCLSPEIQSVFTKPILASAQRERWSDYYYSFIVGNIGNFKRIRAFFKDMDWAQRKNIKERKSYFTILEEVKQEALKLPNIISLDETTRNHFAYRFSSIGDVVTHLRSNFMTLCFDEARCLKILSTNLPDSCNPNRTSLCFLLTHYNENLRANIQTSLVQDKTFDFSGLESLIPGMQEWNMKFETNRTKMESKLSSQITELIRSYSADKIRLDNQF